ncbi:MAG TPA: DUF2267 domain-containing protein, partial [Minicystis sp.]|nr:DUF2267 domain-containing protein [Minicystis sp.]
LAVGADVDEVLRGMREHGVRRLVVTEDGLPVGIVTLDDLLLDEAIDVGQARGVLVPQFEGAAAFGDRRPGDFDARVRARRRRRARMESSYARLVRGVEHHTGLGSRERAERALEIVVGAVCRRLMPEEARHFVAQLPAKMHPDLAACFDGPDKRITARSIELELGRALTLEDRAYDVLCATCAAVADAVSGGAMDAVRGQLPAGMKELFPAPPIRRAV